MAALPALSQPTVADRFFLPLRNRLASCRHHRSCHSLPDSNWLELLVARVLFPDPSGRAFLQEHASCFVDKPSLGLFFESLKSSRRLALVSEVNALLQQSLPSLFTDRFTDYPALQDFDVYAGDGHWHAAAVHDPVIDGTKFASGHFYGINLRHGGVFHLTGADFLQRRKEHDMRALKRLDVDRLRRGAPNRRKVLWVWDKAGIDFLQWYRWKHSAGIYFVSRAKENMVRDVVGENRWDTTDPINSGVLDDVQVGSSQGVAIRWIRYRDPVDGEVFELITSETTLSPGLIVHLYRLRWEIEKSFDEFKNKFGEKKSWASSSVAKDIQAQSLCLAHTLLMLFDKAEVEARGITNVAEDARREERITQLETKLRQSKENVPSALRAFLRCTQHSVKFIRWLRTSLLHPASLEAALPRLRAFYATP